MIVFISMPACSNAKETMPKSKVKAPTVQQPVVAGSFYPADPSILRGFVDRYLKTAPVKRFKGHLMGLIAPHAGYKYSGLVAARSFKQLEGRSYKTVVIIAPSHHVPIKGAALLAKDFYRTPLGDVPIAKDKVRTLINKYSWADDDRRPFDVEHSLEVELPFIQAMLKDFELVPIIVGAHDEKTLSLIADALNEEFSGDDVLFVASSDLSHYKPYEEAVKLDKRTLSYVEKGDPAAFWKAEEDGKVLACGAAPVYIAMQIWKQRGGGEINVLQYLNSGDTAGDKSGVVGYAAIALLTDVNKSKSTDKTDEGNFTLTGKQREKLLKLAKETVLARVRGKRLPPIETDDPLLKKNGAVFVTLRNKGELRGCIGHIIAREPLIENVRNMAVQAATNDMRFPPVRPGELKDIHVEISVLTPPQLLENPMEVKVGTDGLIIERGFNRGVLLPQVPTEQGWNKDEYLKGICRKAGMEATCWKTARLEKFQAIVFGE